MYKHGEHQWCLKGHLKAMQILNWDINRQADSVDDLAGTVPVNASCPGVIINSDPFTPNIFLFRLYTQRYQKKPVMEIIFCVCQSNHFVSSYILKCNTYINISFSVFISSTDI